MPNLFNMYARKILDANNGVASTEEFTLFHSTTIRFVRVGHDDPQRISVRLYATDIIHIYDDGTIILSSGGYKTATTKRKMNLALAEIGFAVVSIRGQWYVIDTKNDTSEMFFDGIQIDGSNR